MGHIARKIYDPKGDGAFIDIKQLGVEGALARTAAFVKERRPIFEAGFAASGALAFADILLPVNQNGSHKWRLVEVKASTSVKDYHRDDCAIQAFVARKSGLHWSNWRLRMSTAVGPIREW